MKGFLTSHEYPQTLSDVKLHLLQRNPHKGLIFEGFGCTISFKIRRLLPLTSEILDLYYGLASEPKVLYRVIPVLIRGRNCVKNA